MLAQNKWGNIKSRCFSLTIIHDVFFTGDRKGAPSKGRDKETLWTSFLEHYTWAKDGLSGDFPTSGPLREDLHTTVEIWSDDNADQKDKAEEKADMSEKKTKKSFPLLRAPPFDQKELPTNCINT